MRDAPDLAALYAVANPAEIELLDELRVRAGLARRCPGCGELTPTGEPYSRTCVGCAAGL